VSLLLFLSMSVTATVTAPSLKRRKAADPHALPPATLSEFDGVRYLHLGGTPWVQGAMRIRQPKKLVLEYVQRMMAWLLLVPAERWDAQPDLHVVQFGLGAATLTRQSHSVMKLCTSAVELNPDVVAACRQWFHLPDNNELLNVQVGDAGAWAMDAEHVGTVDVLQIDLYDHEAAAPALDHEDFYRHCHALLADGGVMVVNLFGRQASFARSAHRVAAGFGAGQVRMMSATKEGNTVVLARKPAAGEAGDQGWPARELMQQRAELAEARWQLPATKWLKLIKPLPAPRQAAPTVTTT
jgi:spermidine synthase